MAKTSSSVIPPSDLSNLEGSLSLTSMTDLLQFISMCAKSGELRIVQTPNGVEAAVYCEAGTLVHAHAGRLQGMSALVEVLGWGDGYFRFKPDVVPSGNNVALPLQFALMEAMRLRDENRLAASTRSTEMAQRTSTDVLQDILKTPGINAVVVVGRDGFLIESVGNANAVDLDSIGAALAHAINGVEELGGDLKIDKFQDMFVEYKRSVILCQPAGDSIVALVSPDASKLGIIRHKAKKLIEELAAFF
jgi:predicted regulator of Ras-like GTPase activity (Roadblock/LC7/MglB family)